jgi:hypothetical protein
MQWLLLGSISIFIDSISSEVMLSQLILAIMCPTSKSIDPKASTWIPRLLPECNDTSKQFIAKGTDWFTVIVRDSQIAAVTTVFSLTLLGDVVGRKPIVLLATGVSCLDKVLLALAPHPYIIHYTHVACGLFASTILVFAVVFSAVADISGTTGSNRSRDFSWTEAGIAVGVSLGPYIGGLTAKKFGIQLPFYLSAVGFLFIFIYILMIQETLPKDKRTRLVCRLTSSVLSTQSSVNTSSKDNNNQHKHSQEQDPLLLSTDTGHDLPSATVQSHSVTSMWRISPIGAILIYIQSWDWIVLTSLMFCSWFAMYGFIFVISLYAKYRFNWGAYEIVRIYVIIHCCYCGNHKLMY